LHLDIKQTQGTTVYQAFLDFSKAYDSVSRNKLLQILQHYGVGPNILQMLTNFWANLWVAPRQGTFFGQPIKTERGVTQGDPLSPILFNILVDAVIRHTKHLLGTADGIILFYADDGLITSTDQQLLQQFLDTITELFANLGLHINPNKTKILVGRPTITNHRICDAFFNCRFGGTDPTYTEYMKEEIECQFCQLKMKRKSIPHHYILKHNHYERPTRRNLVLPMFQENSETFFISMNNRDYVDCPVPSCPATYYKRNTMRQHFNFRHWHRTIIIAEEGLLPQCPRCLLFCSIAHQPRHFNSATCRKGTL
jgi:Reverse transcriptase (RNA-dependent DNA polymerase)